MREYARTLHQKLVRKLAKLYVYIIQNKAADAITLYRNVLTKLFMYDDLKTSNFQVC